jgi:hypothetical protein
LLTLKEDSNSPLTTISILDRVTVSIVYQRRH